MNIETAAKKLRHKTLHTDGKGWSPHARSVRIQSVRVVREEPTAYSPEEELFLLVKFDPKTWDVDKHGFIYTDETWLRELRRELRKLGYPEASSVNYTEQGMQGDTYVHLIVGKW